MKLTSYPLDTTPRFSGAVKRTSRTATPVRNFVGYFRVTPDNRLLFGGCARLTNSNARSDVISGAVLRRSMIEVIRGLAMTRADYRWGGMVSI